MRGMSASEHLKKQESGDSQSASPQRTMSGFSARSISGTLPISQNPSVLLLSTKNPGSTPDQIKEVSLPGMGSGTICSGLALGTCHSSQLSSPTLSMEFNNGAGNGNGTGTDIPSLENLSFSRSPSDATVDEISGIVGTAHQGQGSSPVGSFVGNAAGASLLPANKQTTYLIGICGGTASGKTTVAEIINGELPNTSVTLLSLDSFYCSLTEQQKAAARQGNHDFDHPTSFDMDLAFESLRQIKASQGVNIPTYDFTTHSRRKETTYAAPSDVVIVEGLLLFMDPRIRDLMDIKIFVDADADIRLARRLRRDISERGRDVHGIIKQYMRFVKPSFDEYIFPSSKFADIILPRGADNLPALDLIVKLVKRELVIRANLKRSASVSGFSPVELTALLGKTIVAPPLASSLLQNPDDYISHHPLNCNNSSGIAQSSGIATSKMEATAHTLPLADDSIKANSV